MENQKDRIRICSIGQMNGQSYSAMDNGKL